MSENKNRRPKGLPVGGQFAASARLEADIASLTDDDADIAYGGRPEPSREDLIGPTRDCRGCGETLIADPAGSPDVWVHADDNGQPDYDKDLEHDPVPDDGPDDLGLSATDWAEAGMSALMDTENAANGAYDPGATTPVVTRPIPVGDLRVGTRVSLDGDLVTITSTDGDHKSVSIEFDHDPDTIASYDHDETLDVVIDPEGFSDPMALREGACLDCGDHVIADDYSGGVVHGGSPAGHPARLADPDSDLDVAAQAAQEAALLLAGSEREPGTFQGKTAADWREQAAAARKRSADSFDRSDTDGFLSQWASEITARKHDACASLAEQGGRAEFPALLDMGGKPVRAKLIQTKFGSAFMLLDEDDQATGEFVNLSKARKADKRNEAYAKKGYQMATVRVPAAVALGDGLQPMPYFFRTDGGFDPNAEITSVGETEDWD